MLTAFTLLLFGF